MVTVAVRETLNELAEWWCSLCILFWLCVPENVGALMQRLMKTDS